MLLGTRYTMEMDFYSGRLEAQGLRVIVPDAADRAAVSGIIYDELCHGIIRPESRAVYQAVIGKAVEKGAQGVILGCTEIGLLIGEKDSPVPVFDTARIHVEAALDYALEAAEIN